MLTRAVSAMSGVAMTMAGGRTMAPALAGADGLGPINLYATINLSDGHVEDVMVRVLHKAERKGRIRRARPREHGGAVLMRRAPLSTRVLRDAPQGMREVLFELEGAIANLCNALSPRGYDAGFGDGWHTGMLVAMRLLAGAGA